MDLDPPTRLTHKPQNPALEWLNSKPGIRQILIVLLVLAAFATAVGASSLVISALPGDAVLTAGAFWLVGLMTALIAVGTVAREYLYWRLPLRRLSDTVAEIRVGKAPIADLDKATGGARRLTPAIRDLLIDRRELRRQMEIASDESRRKVASTVDNFERQMGVLKLKASRDGLTGLFNRRTLDEVLPSLLERARQTGHDAGLLMVDVDYFKTLNDTLGHSQGDEFLRQLSQIIKSVLRSPNDMAFRYGGDEFALLFHDMNEEQLCDTGLRLQQMVDAASRAFNVDPRPGISTGGASIGFTGSIDPAELLKRADAVLYEAKHNRPGRPGRNNRSAA